MISLYLLIKSFLKNQNNFQSLQNIIFLMSPSFRTRLVGEAKGGHKIKVSLIIVDPGHYQKCLKITKKNVSDMFEK